MRVEALEPYSSSPRLLQIVGSESRMMKLNVPAGTFVEVNE